LLHGAQEHDVLEGKAECAALAAVGTHQRIAHAAADLVGLQAQEIGDFTRRITGHVYASIVLPDEASDVTPPS